MGIYVCTEHSNPVLLQLKCNMWTPEVCIDTCTECLSSLSLQLHCCGVHNFTSWLGSAYFPASGIPASCCVSYSDCSSVDLRNATVAARKVHKQVGKKDSPHVGKKVGNCVKTVCGWMSVAVVSAGVLRAGDVLHRGQYGDYRWSYLWHRLFSGTTRDRHFPNS